ncbi:hypothetical protein ACJX0J_017647, partial [Zea mays]
AILWWLSDFPISMHYASHVKNAYRRFATSYSLCQLTEILGSGVKIETEKKEEVKKTTQYNGEGLEKNAAFAFSPKAFKIYFCLFFIESCLPSEYHFTHLDMN